MQIQIETESVLKQDFQQGQVLVEAVIVLTLLTLLLAAVLGTAQMQLHWHQDVLDAHHAAQRIAVGHSDQSIAGQYAELRHLKHFLAHSKQPTVAKLQDYDVQLTAVDLMHDKTQTQGMATLLGEPATWVAVTMQSKFSNHAWELRGHGGVSYADQTIARIEGSETLWRQAARQSNQIVKRLAPLLNKMDRPWGRADVPIDWVSTWTDLSEFDARAAQDSDSPWINEVVAAGKKFLGGFF